MTGHTVQPVEIPSVHSFGSHVREVRWCSVVSELQNWQFGCKLNRLWSLFLGCVGTCKETRYHLGMRVWSRLMHTYVNLCLLHFELVNANDNRKLCPETVLLLWNFSFIAQEILCFVSHFSYTSGNCYGSVQQI